MLPEGRGGAQRLDSRRHRRATPQTRAKATPSLTTDLKTGVEASGFPARGSAIHGAADRVPHSVADNTRANPGCYPLQRNREGTPLCREDCYCYLSWRSPAQRSLEPARPWLR